MDQMRAIRGSAGVERPAQRARRVASAAVLVAGLALALPGQAEPGEGHHGWGGPGGWIERHAEELGLDEATLTEIKQILDTSRGQAEAIYEEHRAAREAMHQLLDQDEPDRDAVMKQAEVMGEIDVRKHKHRLATMLEIRSKLTPEQRAKLDELKDEMHEHHGKFGMHGRHHHGEGGCEERGDPLAEQL